MAMESDAPNGFCKVPGCGMIMMNAKIPGSNVTGKICPRHGAGHEAPSGQVNTMQDPGAAGYKIIKNREGYDESVPIMKPDKAASMIAVPEAGVVEKPEDVKQRRTMEPNIFLPVEHLAYLDNGTGVTVLLDKQQAQKIYDGLCSLEPPKTMKDARNLVKLMDTLEEIING